MNILIDTNILVKLYEDTKPLKNRTIELVHTCDTLNVSSLSFCEIAIKECKKPGSFPKGSADYMRIARADGYQILNPAADIAPILETLPMHHKDPFDRMIIAQAMFHNLSVVTKDQVFSMYDIEVIEA